MFQEFRVIEIFAVNHANGELEVNKIIPRLESNFHLILRSMEVILISSWFFLIFAHAPLRMIVSEAKKAKKKNSIH